MKRTARFDIRCTPDQKAAWVRAANRDPYLEALPEGSRLSEWIRRELDWAEDPERRKP